jgi:hypothetical protein
MNSTNEVPRLANVCAGLLDDARTLLQRIPDETYRESLVGAEGGIGAQIRHCIDACSCLLEGVVERRVDYDRRRREARIEVDRRAASARLESLARSLRHTLAKEADHPLRIRLDEPDLPSEAGWTQSTLARELRFVASHVIHHFAIIALLLRSQGTEVPPDFGVAPSTLGHRRRAG